MSDAQNELVQHACNARGVHTLCLNRPDAFNVLSTEVMQAIQRCLDLIAQDAQVARYVISILAKPRAAITIGKKLFMNS